jgi:tRNA dimethylallyltransferase
MPKVQLPKIVVVCGPTASGKTALALDMAKKFHGEIVIADSRQMYQEMKIGTNSPTDVELQKIPHHLFNFVSPEKKFNVSEFKILAEKTIDEILSRKKLPILVGGTGLYLKAVIDNFDFSKTKPDEMLRAKLEEQTLDDLLTHLDSLAESSLAESDRKNRRRVIRALEIALGSKTEKGAGKPRYEVLQMAPKIDREKLYERINARVLEMIKLGLEKEVLDLAQKYSWNVQGLSGIGYREFRPYLEGVMTLESVISEIQKDTRHYAKRQLTWFKADPRIHWIASAEEAESLTQKFLK